MQSPTAILEIEPGLRRLSNLEEFQDQFNQDKEASRLVLLLSSGCPSCVAGAEWIQRELLQADPDLQLRIYAVWFATVDASQLPAGTNALWDPEVLDDARVVSYWDPQRAVGEYFAGNLELQGLERSTVPRTFGGLQWGAMVWDAYYLFGPGSTWEEAPNGLVQSGYPILDARADITEALAVAGESQGKAVTQGTFQIDPQRSVVTYRVQETLLGRNLNIAVGFTEQIEGTIELDLENLETLVMSPMVVDISTLRSDNFLRDERIRVEFLESLTYPQAVFTANSLTGLPPSASEGEEVAFEITGTLEVREIEAPTTFRVTARLENGELTGHAEGTVLMTDFGFLPPAIGELIAAENEVQLEIDFVAVPVSP